MTISTKKCSNPECTKANPQPVNNFYKNRRAKDGMDSRCKTCRNLYYAEYRQTEYGRERIRIAANKYAMSERGKEKQRARERQDSYREKRRAYWKEYGQRDDVKRRGRQKARRHYRSEKGQRWLKDYVSSEHGKSVRNAASAKWKKRHPERCRANQAVRHAITSGKVPHISTQECAGCKNQADHYHHYLGYSQEHWLDIISVCRRCHIKIHNDELVLIREHTMLPPTDPPVPLV